jgi:hypothetical protein
LGNENQPDWYLADNDENERVLIIARDGESRDTSDELDELRCGTFISDRFTP